MRVFAMHRLKPLMIVSACVGMAWVTVTSAWAIDDQWPPAMPETNPYLANSYNNQGHWNDAATDSTLIAVPRGHFAMTEQGYDILPNDSLGSPFYASKVGGKDIRYFWSGFNYHKYHKTDEGYQHIASVAIDNPLPGYKAVTASRRLAQATEIERLLKAGDEGDLADYLAAQPNRLLSAVEDQVSQGVLYSLLAKDDVLIAANARGLIRIAQADPADPFSSMLAPQQVNLPPALFDDERAAAHTFFPADTVFGLGMTFNGVLVLNTVSGRLVSVDPETFEILDSYILGEGEVISNSFATSPELDGQAIYVASNKALYRFLVTSVGKFVTDEQQGAWRAPYPEGRRLAYGKIATGTGATPTLMGFGDDEDELVVLTDGSDTMALLAFWRNSIPSDAKGVEGLHPRVAASVSVDFGDNLSQSEQSVVVAGPYAFVVSSVPPRAMAPLPARGAYLRGLLTGVTREPVMGLAMYRWDSAENIWQPQWLRDDVGSLATVPMLSIPTRQVIINGYFKDRLGEGYHMGFDIDSGDVVMSIATGIDPLFNGTFTGLKCDPDGHLWYTMMSGLVTLYPERMTQVANPDPRL
jgi:hypothetical protein